LKQLLRHALFDSAENDADEESLATFQKEEGLFEVELPRPHPTQLHLGCLVQVGWGGLWPDLPQASNEENSKD
jgi:hypothetical protein